MSLFGAMQSGISGLASQSTSMGAISDNISNPFFHERSSGIPLMAASFILRNTLK